MTGNERIRNAFTWLRKSRHSTKLAQTVKIRLASGQHLMHIRLMTNIEYQTVNFSIIDGLKGDRKLHRAQIGGKVATGL